MKELEVADIRIVFEDDRPDVKLKPPTADIAFAINRQVGGFRNLLARIEQADLEAYFAILSNAAEIADGDDDGLRHFIWQNPGEVHMAALNYGYALLNGGKSIEMILADREAAGESDDDDEAASEEETKKESAKPATRRKAS